MTFLCQRSSVEQTVAARHGYDIPPFEGLRDFKTWAEEAPPKGTIYHYPPRGDVEMVIRYSPAPARRGPIIDQAIAWAGSELEGFSRI